MSGRRKYCLVSFVSALISMAIGAILLAFLVSCVPVPVTEYDNNENLITKIPEIVNSVSEATPNREVCIAVDFLNVRRGPGEDFESVDLLRIGDCYAVRSEENGWLLLENIGWVNADSPTCGGNCVWNASP